MNYGFAIDNRKCIGCHACTVACKSEHDVPVGVNRTHVKYIEKGVFPNTVREFSVHRCNHCENAPCVTICPTAALYQRADGIVDFDNSRCIGCKSCMQACPYDALYIDPDTRTSAKCNYCAHRIDRGYEPACVVICPVEAIVSGDLDDPDSRLSRLISREATVVRKPEMNTRPNLFYVGGDTAMLTPEECPRSDEYLWSEQTGGVGHHAEVSADPYAEKDMKNLLVTLALESHAENLTAVDQRAVDAVSQEISTHSNRARRVYDSPSKGVLWGWEVPAYIWTKALATGIFMVFYLWKWFMGDLSDATELKALISTLVFLTITGGLLIKDLDRPDRFLYVLLRPDWSSWLTRGGYIITVFGGLTTLLIVNNIFNLGLSWVAVPGILFALLGAIYTAFLLAQARGRDLWQSSLSPLQMLIHALIAGLVLLTLLDGSVFIKTDEFLIWALWINFIFLMQEILVTHSTADSIQAMKIMTEGAFEWFTKTGIFLSSIVPIIGLAMADTQFATVVAGSVALVGIYMTEFVRIRVPQLVPLS